MIKTNGGWLYIIKNGDLYKIGITRKFENRMRYLKPDNVVAKLYSRDFKQLEREFHKRYKKVRIPQTEYFRLSHAQIREIRNTFKNFNYPMRINFWLFIKLLFFLLFLFLFLLLFISLYINDINKLIFISLLLMERISFGLSIISLFIKSNKFIYFSNELKFRISRLFILILFTFLFRLASSYFSLIT